MTYAQPSLRLALTSTPECLELVHGALAGVARAAGLDALAGNDLATAVGEAVKNVVLHAYDGNEGPLEVAVAVPGDAVEAVVRDRGIGIRPRLGERTGPHNGIGMPIVHVLSRRVTYTNLPGGGTEVRMELSLPGLAALAALPPEEQATPAPGALAIAVLPGAPAAAVLPRLLDVLLARAGQAPQAHQSLRRVADLLAQGSAGDPALEVLARLDGAEPELLVGPLGASLAAALSSSSEGIFVPLSPGQARPGAVVSLRPTPD